MNCLSGLLRVLRVNRTEPCYLFTLSDDVLYNSILKGASFDADRCLRAAHIYQHDDVSAWLSGGRINLLCDKAYL